MYIHPTRPEELDTAMALYDHARAYMRQNGNDRQWTGGYPSRETVAEDIARGQSYLCCAEDGTPLAVFCFTVGEEPAYRKIYDGAWLNEEPYAVIHRLGVSSHRGGVCSFCIRWCYAQHPNLRVDTHRDNGAMQRLAERMGYTRCGIIPIRGTAEDGALRYAYEKPLIDIK